MGGMGMGGMGMGGMGMMNPMMMGMGGMGGMGMGMGGMVSHPPLCPSSSFNHLHIPSLFLNQLRTKPYPLPPPSTISSGSKPAPLG